MCTII